MHSSIRIFENANFGMAFQEIGQILTGNWSCNGCNDVEKQKKNKVWKAFEKADGF